MSTARHSLAIDAEDNTGWKTEPGKAHFAVFEPEEPTPATDGKVLRVTLEFKWEGPRFLLGCFRLSVARDKVPPPATVSCNDGDRKRIAALPASEQVQEFPTIDPKAASDLLKNKTPLHPGQEPRGPSWPAGFLRGGTEPKPQCVRVFDSTQAHHCSPSMKGRLMSMRSWFAALRPPMADPRLGPVERVPLCVEALEDRTLLSANVIVSSTGIFPQFNLVNPGSDGAFGTQVVTLNTGNIVVTDPAANNGAGAVYLFNGQSGALISTLSGSVSGDKVGSGGVTVFNTGNFVVESPLWSGGAVSDLGAVTFENGLTGTNGTVSAANSLVGSHAGGDEVGTGGVTALSNNNYVVDSPTWDGSLGSGDLGRRHDRGQRNRLGHQQPRRQHGQRSGW